MANYTELSGAVGSIDPAYTVPLQSPVMAQQRHQTPWLLDPNEDTPHPPIHTHTSAAQDAGFENKLNIL